MQEVVRNTVKDISYDSSDKGFDYDPVLFLLRSIDSLPTTACIGVDETGRKEQGAGDLRADVRIREQ